MKKYFHMSFHYVDNNFNYCIHTFLQFLLEIKLDIVNFFIVQNESVRVYFFLINFKIKF